jgi:hypothetical protein
MVPFQVLVFLLAADFLELLTAWRALKAVEGLKRLVLAGNPLLGCMPQPQPGQAQQPQGAAAPPSAPAAPAAAGFLGPQQLFWLEARLFRAAPLCLLDLRHTGELPDVLVMLGLCKAHLLRQHEVPHTSLSCGCCRF